MVFEVDEKVFGINRDQLYSELKRFNIMARKYFHPLCSHFQCYRNHRSSSSENLQAAEMISRRVLSLPLFGTMKFEDVIIICNAIKYIRQKFQNRIYAFRTAPDGQLGNIALTG